MGGARGTLRTQDEPQSGPEQGLACALLISPPWGASDGGGCGSRQRRLALYPAPHPNPQQHPLLPQLAGSQGVRPPRTLSPPTSCSRLLESLTCTPPLMRSSLAH